jgi:hypothetical protein
MLGAVSTRSELFMLVGALFKKFGLFLNTPRMSRHDITIQQKVFSVVALRPIRDIFRLNHFTHQNIKF